MKYLIHLAIADPTFPGGLEKYSQDIRGGITYFNLHSANTKNPKLLSLVELQDRLCVVELVSGKELPVPAKALRLFTQYLLEHSELSQYVYHSCLFRNVRAASSAPASVPTPNYSEMVEVQVMDRLTRLLVGPRSARVRYFSAIQTLFDCSKDMEESCLEQYLSGVAGIMVNQAQALGHGSDSAEKRET